MFNEKVLIKSQQRFRSDHHKVYTEEVNKIALSSNDDKRIQTSDRITTYPYGMEIDVDSQKLIEESENTRKESAQIIASSQKLREELKAIRKESSQIIARSQKLRKELNVIRKESAQIITRSQSPKNKSVNVSTQAIFIDEALQYRNEALQYRNEIAKIRDDDTDNDTDKEVSNDVDKINDDIDKDKEINNDVDKINDGNTEEVIDDTIKTKKEINDEINDCTNEEIIDDDTEKVSNDAYVANEEIIDDDTEETVYIKMLNKMITKVNEFKLAEFTYASCFDEVNEILVKEGNICDDEIYEDPWLKINELYGINKLFYKFFDKIWKLASDKNRKVDKKININKYLKIDKYTDITDGKLDLFINIGSILAKATSEIQNEAYIVNDLKQNENVDINMLK